MTAATSVTLCPEIHAATDHITAVSRPLSVFLYGSRARGDAGPSSDFEFAAVYRDEDLVSRSQLIVSEEKLATVNNRIAIYPFRVSDLVEGRVDAPFPAAIFLNEVHETAVGLLGPSPQDIFAPPSVRVSDAVVDCFLVAGRALAGLDAVRAGELAVAACQARKSRYTALRIAVLVRQGDLIHRAADLEVHAEIVLAERPALLDLGTPDESASTQRALYEAISMITQVLLPDLQSRPPSSTLLPKAARG